MRAVLLASIALALAASPVLAEADGCKDFRWPVAREQAAFAGGSLPEVTSGSTMPEVGHAALLRLAPQDTVTFPVAVSRKPKTAAPLAGSFPLPPLAAGTYQVTLSDDAWIEVAQDGVLLKQVGFTGSHSCPTVHKSVRFDLAAGPATIEISDAGQDTIKIDVVPKEP